MKTEQNLDFGVYLAPLAADDAIVTTTGSVATDNTCLTTVSSGRVCVLRFYFVDKISNVPKHAVWIAPLHHTVYQAERKHSFESQQNEQTCGCCPESLRSSMKSWFSPQPHPPRSWTTPFGRRVSSLAGGALVLGYRPPPPAQVRRAPLLRNGSTLLSRLVFRRQDHHELRYFLPCCPFPLDKKNPHLQSLHKAKEKKYIQLSSSTLDTVNHPCFLDIFMRTFLALS